MNAGQGIDNQVASADTGAQLRWRAHKQDAPHLTAETRGACEYDEFDGYAA
jgi:hypothetical protein